MRRRQVLASAALLSIAGCTGPGGSGGMVVELPTARLSMETVTDADVARKVTRHELSDDERTALNRIVDGRRTTDWHVEPPVHTSMPVLHEGTVYRLSTTVVDSQPATRYSVTVDIPDRTPDPGEAVQFEDLPAADREKFAAFGLDDGGFVGFGTTFVYTHDEVERSVLVPDSEYGYIQWDDGTTASWAVDGSWETELNRYRYTAEATGSVREYGGQIRERYAFDLTGLPEGERAIVEEAIADEGGYTVPPDATPPPAFESLVDRFRPRDEVVVHDEPDPDVSGRYLARYDGDLHWTGLRLWRDVEERDGGPATDDGSAANGTVTRDDPTPTATDDDPTPTATRDG